MSVELPIPAYKHCVQSNVTCTWEIVINASVICHYGLRMRRCGGKSLYVSQHTHETAPSCGDSECRIHMKKDWKGNDLVACVQMSRSFVAAQTVFRRLVKSCLTASLVPGSSTVLDHQHLPIQLPHKHHPDTNTQILLHGHGCHSVLAAALAIILSYPNESCYVQWNPMAIILCELHSVIDIQLTCTSCYFVHSVCTRVWHSSLIYSWYYIRHH